LTNCIKEIITEEHILLKNREKFNKKYIKIYKKLQAKFKRNLKRSKNILQNKDIIWFIGLFIRLKLTLIFIILTLTRKSHSLCS